VNFKTYLQEKVDTYDTMLVIIGNSWLTMTEESGERRLDNPNDFVRIEIAAALQRPDMQVIPVLVQGATMPRAQDLPDDLKDLHFRNALQVRQNPDFTPDMAKLIEQIRHSARAGQKAGLSRRIFLPVLGGLALVTVIVIIGAVLLTQPDSQRTITPTASNLEGQTAYVHTNRTFVNVFDQPDLESDIVGTVRNRETLIQFPATASEGWIQIETDEFTGWVTRDAVHLEACAYIADGYDAPVGTADERRSNAIWPGDWINSRGFATRDFLGVHSGVDLNLNVPEPDSDLGAPVYAAADGIVTFAEISPRSGSYIVIVHDPLYTCDGRVLYSRYANVSDILVASDDRVVRGQMIASVGKPLNTSTGSLHFDNSRSPGL
jgi:murein DD-endopeptidase MepM/ murein hydrolase activator NlpD